MFIRNAGNCQSDSVIPYVRAFGGGAQRYAVVEGQMRNNWADITNS